MSTAVGQLLVWLTALGMCAAFSVLDGRALGGAWRDAHVEEARAGSVVCRSGTAYVGMGEARARDFEAGRVAVDAGRASAYRVRGDGWCAAVSLGREIEDAAGALCAARARAASARDVAAAAAEDEAHARQELDAAVTSARLAAGDAYNIDECGGALIAHTAFGARI